MARNYLEEIEKLKKFQDFNKLAADLNMLKMRIEKLEKEQVDTKKFNDEKVFRKFVKNLDDLKRKINESDFKWIESTRKLNDEDCGCSLDNASDLEGSFDSDLLSSIENQLSFNKFHTFPEQDYHLDPNKELSNSNKDEDFDDGELSKNLEKIKTLDNEDSKKVMFEKIKKLCKQRLEEMGNQKAAQSEDTLKILDCLAIVYYEQAKFNRTLKQLKEILRIQRLIYGDFDGRICDTLNRISQVYSEMKKFPKAESFSILSLKITEHVLGNSKNL